MYNHHHRCVKASTYKDKIDRTFDRRSSLFKQQRNWSPDVKYDQNARAVYFNSDCKLYLTRTKPKHYTQYKPKHFRQVNEARSLLRGMKRNNKLAAERRFVRDSNLFINLSWDAKIAKIYLAAPLFKRKRKSSSETPFRF
jgi:hypothetical protein